MSAADRSLLVLGVLLLTASFVCAVASIWTPGHRAQFAVTALVCAIVAAAVIGGLQQKKKEGERP